MMGFVIIENDIIHLMICDDDESIQARKDYKDFVDKTVDSVKNILDF